MTFVARHRFAFAFILLVATIVFIDPLVKREVFTLRDHFDYFQPLRYFTAQELRAGRLPFWNPYNAAGEPWMANPQTGVFYPPAWLFVVLPFETAYVLFLLLHLVILGWGAYLFFARGAPPGAALVGAVALMFAGPVLSLLDVSNNLATFAWIPLALWCAAEGAWRRGAIVLTLAFLGGEPFFAAVGALLYVVISRRSYRSALLAGVFAFGLSAIQLLPFLDFVRTSDRAEGMDAATILSNSVRLLDWLRIAVPSRVTLGQTFIPIMYLGLSVVVLAGLGITTIRRNRSMIGWLTLLAATIVVASGPAFLARMPVTLFRYPARVLPFAALAFAALAVRGWERIRNEKRWLDLIVVLVVVVDLVPRMRPLLRSEPFNPHPVPYERSIGTTSNFVRVGNREAANPAAWISGYLNLYDRRFDVFTAAPLTSEAYMRAYRQLVAQPTVEQFARLGVGFVLSQDAMPEVFIRIARHGSVNVYRTPVEPPMAALFWREPMTMRRAKWELDTSHARVTIDAPHDGILVLRQKASRGWSMTVDGKSAKPQVIDGFFRGVLLTRGHHEVIWTYDPPLFSIGVAMTIVTLVTLQLSIFVKRSRT